MAYCPTATLVEEISRGDRTCVSDETGARPWRSTVTRRSGRQGVHAGATKRNGGDPV